MVQAIQLATISESLIGIVFLDLDSFKNVNDTMGHEYGDKLLVRVSEMLKQCLKKTDIVSRFGGDEFLIMLNNINDMEDVERAVTKLMKQFEEPIFIEDQEFYVTASAGISIFPYDGQEKETLIKNADIAMYKAKNNGKNQFAFCSAQMKEEVEQTRLLTNHLYHAQEKKELEIVYQPQVSVKTGQVIAIEALARWRHPELGSIPPSVFIPIAEHTGLINGIGEWIMREACSQNRKWQEMGLPPVRLAVNVSVNQLRNPGFIHQVLQVLNETKLHPDYLELEITENIAMQQSDFITRLLQELKDLGISLAIDDFGVEYSSLNRIKMLPIDRLKIDMHFVRGILECEKDRAIVDVIIKLAKDLQLKVIAEGVETEAQVQYLLQKECDEAQGYYYHKPLSKEEIERLLLTRES